MHKNDGFNMSVHHPVNTAALHSEADLISASDEVNIYGVKDHQTEMLGQSDIDSNNGGFAQRSESLNFADISNRFSGYQYPVNKYASNLRQRKTRKFFLK